MSANRSTTSRTAQTTDVNETSSDKPAVVHTTESDTSKSTSERDAAELAELRAFKAEQEQRDREAQKSTPTAAPAGEDVNLTASDEKPATKLFAVVSHLGEDRQQTEIVAAESAYGLEQKSKHAYGLADDQIQIFELHTV